MSTRSRKIALFLLPALALTASACGRRELPQNALDPQGPVAEQLDRLWDPVFLIAAGIFVLVQALIVVAVVKFRARSDDDAPVQIHGNARYELAWTIAPALILLIVGIYTVATVFDIDRRAEGAEVLNVRVIGHQWWWEYQYPGLDIVTANELYIPAGRRVQLEMTSADVIHSFWPPKLAGKVDVVPKRINHMQLEARQPGVYYGQCAEYCGLSHANMRLRVVALGDREFDEWVRGQQRDARPATSGAALAGQELFIQRGCNGCHAVEGLEGANGRIGPNLTHLMSRETFAGGIFELNEPNLRRWLRNPPKEKPMMPENGIGMPDLGLSEDEITNLIAYLETLN